MPCEECGSTQDVRLWHHPMTDSSENAELCEPCRYSFALAFNPDAYLRAYYPES